MSKIMVVLMLSLSACGRGPEYKPCDWTALNGSWGQEISCVGGKVHFTSTQPWDLQGLVRSPSMPIGTEQRMTTIEVLTRGRVDFSATLLDQGGLVISQKSLLPSPDSGSVEVRTAWTVEATVEAVSAYFTAGVPPNDDAWLDDATITSP